jgi:signal transduction histidine kinase
MRRLIQRPLALPKQVAMALALVLLALIGWVDYVTGWEVRMTAFYLAPIGWACWSAGRKAGLCLAVVAVITWLTANWTSSYDYKYPPILYWNALMLFVFFIVVVYLLSAFQTAHHHLQDVVQRRTAALQAEITERKRAEEQLRQSHQQLRALNTRLQEVREEERTRIARELHDELGQVMTGLKMELAWIGKHLAKPGESLPTTIGHKVAEMTKLINGTIHSVRRISSELRPGLLDDLGLAAAIEWQARDFESRSGIACELAVPADGVNLNRETSTAVFRIFQETLTNVVRHANATKVKVSVCQEGRRVILEVTDNGRGITAGSISDKSSLGLLGMRERAALFGGEVNFVGVAGQGTTVTVTIPQP